MANNKRLIWADSLKGWLIILVIFGHVLQNTLGERCESNHLWNIIYSFHMPAFMAISGYVAYRSKRSRGESCLSIIYRRFKQLVVPFILWSILLLLINTSLSFKNAIALLLYPDGGLWFLWVLFIINVLFVFGSWLAEILKIKQAYIIVGIGLVLAGIMIVFDFRLFGFQFIAYYYLFYSLGYFLNKYNEQLVTKNKYVIILLSLAWLVFAWFWNMHKLPVFLNAIPLPGMLLQYIYRFVTAVMAIYVLIAASPLVLNKENGFNRPFVNLGTISLGIYTTHFILIKKIVDLCLRWGVSDDLAIISSFIIALLISWLIVWLLSKWKITAKYLLGKL